MQNRIDGTKILRLAPVAGGDWPPQQMPFGRSAQPFIPTSASPFLSNSFTFEANDERVSESRAQVTQNLNAQTSGSSKDIMGGTPLFVKIHEMQSGHDKPFSVMTYSDLNIFLRAYARDRKTQLTVEDVLKLFSIPGVNRAQIEHNDLKKPHVGYMAYSVQFFQIALLMEGLYDDVPNIWGDPGPLQVVGFLVSQPGVPNLLSPRKDMETRPLQILPAWSKSGTRCYVYGNYSRQIYAPHHLSDTSSASSRRSRRQREELEEDYSNYLNKRQRENAVAYSQTLFPLNLISSSTSTISIAQRSAPRHSTYNTLTGSPKANYDRMKASIKRMIEQAFPRRGLGLDESTIELVASMPGEIKTVTNTYWSLQYEESTELPIQDYEMRSTSYKGNFLSWIQLENNYWELTRMNAAFLPVGIVTSTTAGVAITAKEVEMLTNSASVQEGYDIYRHIHDKSIISLCIRVT